MEKAAGATRPEPGIPTQRQGIATFIGAAYAVDPRPGKPPWGKIMPRQAKQKHPRRAVPTALLEAATRAARQAYCPYSRFSVGAAIQTASGRIVTACNVENASYGLTSCAERNVLAAAIAAGERQFRALAVVGGRSCLGSQKSENAGTYSNLRDIWPYPCGACRQAMAEFCDPHFPIYVARLEKPDRYRALRLGHLMPLAFRPIHRSHPTSRITRPGKR